MIELEQKFEKIPTLREYYKATQNLGEVYNTERNPVGSEWIQFNENLADAIVKIYSYFICLDNNKVDQITHIEQKEKISRFLSFYYDFIVSKPSNTIFTEMQKKSELDLFPLNGYSISMQAKKLFLYENLSNLSEDLEYNIAFQNLFHKIFAYHDFIFSDNEGVFSKFCYDKDLFEYIKTYFDVNDVNEDGINIRELMNNSVVGVIKKTLDYKEQNTRVKNHFLWNLLSSSKDKEHGKKDSEEEETLDHKKIFKEFVNKQKEPGDPKRFEIFTYILANKLWKIDKIYQSRLENTEKAKYETIEEEYEEKSKKYLKDYVSAIDEYYKGSIQEFKLYGKIYELDKVFIGDYVLQGLLENIDDAPLRNVKIEEYDESFFLEPDSPKDSALSVESIVENYAIDNNKHEKFKFYRILEKANADEITHLIDSMHLLIEKQFNQDEYKSLQYMGVLRSGSFLSHTLNILKYYSTSKEEECTQISESLLTHPYLTILPRNLFDRNEKDVIVVYIDEAIKSGYGITVSHLYRKKILNRKGYEQNIKDCAIVLTDFTDYQNKINNRLDGLKCSVCDSKTISNNIKHYSLSKIRAEEEKLVCEKNSDVEIEKNFAWKTFLEKVQLPREKGTPSLDEALCDYAEKDGRLDFTKVISNSFLLIMTCKYFAKKLRDIIRERQELNELNAIAMYAGSIEGKLLIDMTIFIYKVLYKSEENTKKQLFEINGKGYGNKDNDICLFFDITYITGDTCHRTFKLDVKNKKNTKDFDYKFVIYSECNENNIINLCSNPSNSNSNQS